MHFTRARAVNTWLLLMLVTGRHAKQMLVSGERGGGKRGERGGEARREGEGSGERGGGKRGERGREAGIGYPPVHPQ